MRITVNEALMTIRRRPRYKEVPIDESKETDYCCVPLEIEDWGPNPEQRYSEEELQQILATAINELKRRRKNDNTNVCQATEEN